jgi:uncharacterized protein
MSDQFTPTERTQVKRLPKRGKYDAETVHQILDSAFVCPVCVTVTHLDGIVLARSAFHHSVNYRSVVILGKARLVTDSAEKMEALRIFTDHVMKGRWDDVRQPTDQELKATTVLALPLEEVSAKVRTGGPNDDEPDYDLPIWAGVLPLETQAKPLIPDDKRKKDIPVPTYLSDYTAKHSR